MSYDVYFRSPARRQLTQEDFGAFFSSRPNYKVTPKQAWYSNDITGVYFVFSYGEVPEEMRCTPGIVDVAFSLNHVRPHIFGLEAEPEVAAFVRHFGLLAHDCQLGGMGDCAYSREGFLRAWDVGNEAGYQAVLRRHTDIRIWTMPTAKLEGFWKWNRQIAALQATLGDGVFVPKIMAVECNGKTGLAIVWTDDNPTASPEVDIIIILRQDLAPVKVQGSHDYAILEWSDLRPIMQLFGNELAALPFHRPLPGFDSNTLTEFVRHQKTFTGRINGIPLDRVLNEELVAKYRCV